MGVIRELGRPKVAIMLALGFSSGLPFMLISNTLGFWLAENHIKLATIGYLSWAGLAYLFQFVYGAIADRVRPPLLGKLGRRRGWLIWTQIGVAIGLVGMAAAGPAHLPTLAFFAVITGISAASQDTVMSGWRIEIADDADELGLLTSAYTLGFRAALIFTEAVILVLATAIGWALSYAVYGAAMIIGLGATLLAREPVRTDGVTAERVQRTLPESLRSALDAVIGPIITFFRTHGIGLAALMLLMITLYHLCDYMRGPMSSPYYIALGITKPTIAVVRTTVGLAGSLVGIAVGGISSLRIGNARSLIIGAILQPIGVGAFAILALHGGDFTLAQLGPIKLTAFQAIMTFDAFAIGYSGVALLSYMSTLTSVGYTATQYALLSSALVWSGKILKGFSGAIVESLQHGRDLLHAYAAFYELAAAIGLPALVVCVVLANRLKVRVRALAAASAAPA